MKTIRLDMPGPIMRGIDSYLANKGLEDKILDIYSPDDKENEMMVYAMFEDGFYHVIFIEVYFSDDINNSHDYICFKDIAPYFKELAEDYTINCDCIDQMLNYTVFDCLTLSIFDNDFGMIRYHHNANKDFIAVDLIPVLEAQKGSDNNE